MTLRRISVICVSRMTNITKQNSKKSTGYVMAGIGLLMILANALNYVLGWDGEFTPLMIIGLVLVITGMNLSKKHQDA